MLIADTYAFTVDDEASNRDSCNHIGRIAELNYVEYYYSLSRIRL
jgi:hypothetical protein